MMGTGSWPAPQGQVHQRRSVEYGNIGDMIRQVDMFATEEPKKYYRKETFDGADGSQYKTFAVPKKVKG